MYCALKQQCHLCTDTGTQQRGALIAVLEPSHPSSGSQSPIRGQKVVYRHQDHNSSDSDVIAKRDVLRLFSVRKPIPLSECQ